MNILFVAAEVAPFAKVGGLADVAGALPKALKALGHDVRIAMPCYRMIEENPRYAVRNLIAPFDIPIHWQYTERASVRETRADGDVPVYLVRNDHYFQGAVDSKSVYSLEPEPYIFFCRAVMEAIPRLDPAWKPDVIHCNDWHTGLCPVYLDLYYRDKRAWADTARVFTIHNLAYQGEFSRHYLWRAGLPEDLFTYDRLEFFGRVNFMKGGLIFSEIVNTVSETYSREIQTPEYGANLDGLLRHLAWHNRLSGIVNGIDYEEFNPSTDSRIAARYSAADPTGKRTCKRALQRECGLPEDDRAMVIGMVSRLTDQKGFDLVHQAAWRLMQLPVQIVLLGTGDRHYEQFFRDLEAGNRSRVRANLTFNADLAQRIYAGSDLFLMPSRFEPCGLGQLISLRYGTVPLVRATGGLADTVQDHTDGRMGTGFMFQEYSAGALIHALERALEAFGRPEEWATLVRAGMEANFSWSGSAQKYAELYMRARDRWHGLGTLGNGTVAPAVQQRAPARTRRRAAASGG